jgi:hypothetical protein
MINDDVAALLAFFIKRRRRDGETGWRGLHEYYYCGKQIFCDKKEERREPFSTPLRVNDIMIVALCARLSFPSCRKEKKDLHRLFFVIDVNGVCYRIDRFIVTSDDEKHE